MTTPQRSKEGEETLGRDLILQSGAEHHGFMPSRYNAYTVTPDGTLVLANFLSGALCGIPKPGVPRVKAYLSRARVTDNLDSLGSYLLENGYIVESDADERMRFDIRYASWHYREDKMRLVLLAHEDCNFRCVYCAQSFDRGAMLPEVRTSIKKLIETKQRTLRRLAIDWFGGEPLLGFEAIADLAPFFQSFSAANGVEFTADITTNGYKLTPDVAGQLLDWGTLGFQITLDGLSEDHDRKRPLKSGGSTFWVVLNNITGLKQFSHPFKCRLRINYDLDNVGRLQPLFDLLAQRIGNDPRYRIGLNAVRRWGGPNDAELPIIEAETIRWQHSLRRQAADRGLNVEGVTERLIGNGSMLCFSTLTGGFVIGADGRVMKCTNYSAMPKDLITVGQCGKDGTLTLNSYTNFKWIQPYYHYDSKCQRCFFLPVCHGGLICPAARARGIETQCPAEKSNIRKVLLEHWEHRQRQGTLRRLAVAAACGER